MERNECIEKLKVYNKSVNTIVCSSLEKEFIKTINEQKYFYGFNIKNQQVPEDVQQFIMMNHNFSHLLKEHSEKLCFYLRNIQKYTCNRQLIRMDARSRNFQYYASKAMNAIGSFYMFYGLGLDIKEAVYGQYRQFPIHIDFAPIIAVEIMQGNSDVIQYCIDVFTSENNTAVMTREVIVAVEQADNTELHKLLLDLFVAARLQEGVRQSIIETIDENQIAPFLSMVDVIKEQELLRYSSVQRGILNWIGIGYEIVEEKQVKFIFEHLYEYLHDEEKLQAGFESENPLEVYLACYCVGFYDVDEAIKKAVQLLGNSKRHIVAAALIYLKLTNQFSVMKYMHLAESEDEWVRALFFSECVRENYNRLKINQDEAEKLYHSMMEFLQGMKAQEKYSSKGFEWFSLTISKDSMVLALFRLLKGGSTEKMVNQFLPYVSNMYDSNVKEFMENFYPLASLEHKKAFLLKEIISTNRKLSDYVTEEYAKFSLTEDEMIQLESRLKSKKAYAKANIVRILSLQKKELVQKSYERLIASKEKSIYESAMELKQKVPQYFEEVLYPEVEVKGKEDGFSLYTRKKSYLIPYTFQFKRIKKGFLFKKEYVDLSFLHVLTKEEVLQYMQLWDERIKAHAMDEYEFRGEYRQIGQKAFFPLNYSEKSLNALPLGDVWRQYFMEDGLSEDAVFQLMYHINSVGVRYHKFLSKEIELYELYSEEIGRLEYYSHFCKILEYYFKEVNHEKFAEKAVQFLELMNQYAEYNQYRTKDYQNKDVSYSIAHLNVFSFMINQLDLLEIMDEVFISRFPVLYACYEKFHLQCSEETLQKLNISLLVLARAVHLRLLPETALYEALLDTHSVHSTQTYFYRNPKHRLFEGYRDAYFHGRGLYGKPDFSLEEKSKDACICLRNALDKIADTLIPMEAGRFHEVTDVTEYVQGLRVIRGMRSLIMALHVLEGEEFKRQGHGNDRNSIFSNIIRNCYPIEGDLPEDLKQEGFSEMRLVETAMLAPQWIPIIAEVLQWDGFQDACYYFIAHMKQYDYEKKKAEISQYTDIEPLDLNDGAFDIEWCKHIYQSLGEKRFSMIYQAAKFLCENSFHTRARKYADACLARSEKEVFLKQAKEKRNKDALNAYCICPIENDKDLLERYLYVQQFLKETKVFGSQRQASEKRACEIALMNLARNSRFETVTRLSWIMETEVVQQYQRFLEPQKVGEVEIWIAIDKFGKNEINVSKNGKKLKSVPTSLKKEDVYLEIKEAHTLFNNQYKRSRQMLQTAMEERIVFGKEEMNAISSNPVVAPVLQSLIIRNGGHFGFYKDGKLCGLDENYEVEGEIYIAHPYDLYQAGIWDAYRKHIFEHQMVQPFKQVFRELYLKLEDELSGSFTKRYSGYQIQPQKAAAALKSRRWNVSYENGMERVYHKENLVVHLYADTDWFSPSDIEAPSIDYVAFYQCKNQEVKKIEDIDPVTYSEIMRDVDLAVSTAYVGGVDPITSFSTMELRRSIIEYTCQLMKLKNVTVQEHFANIQGAHNNYHVHLGSGMIHQDGGSSIHMVPVYSGKRGKVYLPFLDEDPMSAQILTKVLMLAEDTKIKDSAILSQIVTKK